MPRCVAIELQDRDRAVVEKVLRRAAYAAAALRLCTRCSARIAVERDADPAGEGSGAAVAEIGRRVAAGGFR